MASQALYRRYRSQTFNELIGQEHIVQTLRNALAEGRIAHAYLFTGPRGVGKTTVARLLAKAVNCTAALELRPCGICDSCIAIAEGSAVDVIEMDAASHTSVEDAREIIERVQFRPAMGQYKVYIIDETHMLSTAAFNALLKTLEEPPAHALFILATTEIHKVPATILSRCQRFTFNRHSIAATVAHLREVASQEGFTLEAGAAEAISRAATGSMRDALSILDQLMSYGSASISLEQVRGLLGATASQEVSALVDALLSSNLTAGLQVIASVAAQGADLRQFTRDLVEQLRSLLLLKATADSSLLDLSEDELGLLQVQASNADLAALLAWTRLFGELDYQLRTSPYGQLPLELAVVEAIAAPVQARSVPVATTTHAAATPTRPMPTTTPVVRTQPVVPAASPISGATVVPVGPVPRSESLAAPIPIAPVVPESSTMPPMLPDTEPVVARTPAPSEPASTARPILESIEGFEAANADAAALERIESVWPEVVRDVRVHDKTLQALLNSGVRPIDMKENIVILEVTNDWLLTRLEKPNLRQIVEKVLSKHMNAAYFIRCVVEAQGRENPNVLREQIRSSRKDPLVKAAINIFDADVIRVETEEE